MSRNVFAIGKAYKVYNPNSITKLLDDYSTGHSCDDDKRKADIFDDLLGEYYENFSFAYNNEFIMVEKYEDTTKTLEGLNKLKKLFGINIDYTESKDYAHVWYNGVDNPIGMTTWKDFEKFHEETQKDCKQNME